MTSEKWKNKKVTVDLGYKNYIFDLYGTLIDIHTEEETTGLWKKVALFYRKQGAFYFAYNLRRKYHQLVQEELKSREEIQVEKVFEKLYLMKKVIPDRELVLQTCRFFREESTEHLELYPWSLPILETLKSNGKKIYLLSNAQRSFTYHEMERLGLLSYFDKIYISSDYGVKKPNPMFLGRLLKEEQLDTVDCLMLGNDQNCDVFGAQQLGMDTWYVHTNCSPEYTKEIQATYEFL